MQITKVTRSYSRSINARNYGMPESWIKVESTYEAEVETADNPLEVSKMLHEQAKKEVVADVNDIIEKMKAANQNLQNVASTGQAPGSVPSQTAPSTLPPNQPTNPGPAPTQPRAL